MKAYFVSEAVVVISLVRNSSSCLSITLRVIVWGSKFFVLMSMGKRQKKLNIEGMGFRMLEMDIIGNFFAKTMKFI